MFDIYIFETFREEEELLRKYLPKEILAEFSRTSIQDSKLEDLPARFISIRTHSVIPKSWLDSSKIEGIISRTTGFDHLKAYRKVPCGYLPSYCSTAVAEQAILLYMSLARKLLEQIEQFQSFDRNNLTGFEIEGKNATIVGIGEIGYKVYKKLKSLGMHVSGIDIVQKYGCAEVRYIGKEYGLKNADVIFCCMNLTKDNVNYFNYETLKKAKPGVFFINTSRGELSPSEDLLRLMHEDHLGGLALDVYNKETLLTERLQRQTTEFYDEVEATLELSNMSNVIFTPHNAFNTKEATKRKVLQTVDQLKYMLKYGKFIWNVPIGD